MLKGPKKFVFYFDFFDYDNDIVKMQLYQDVDIKFIDTSDELYELINKLRDDLVEEGLPSGLVAVGGGIHWTL